jgi:ABC-2 type transport system ATP-binding protein
MDEAERCHQLAYISYGHLLAQGTAAELVAQAGLTTVAITGGDLANVARELRAQESINVASFGNTLHVSAASKKKLDAVLARHRAGGLHIEAVDTTLEDVFIALMQNTKDDLR